MRLHLTPQRVKDPGAAVIYLTDCTLATVAAMTALAKKPKGEFSRQIAIAQHGIDWIIQMKITVQEESPRVERIINEFSGSVKSWAETIK